MKLLDQIHYLITPKKKLEGCLVLQYMIKMSTKWIFGNTQIHFNITKNCICVGFT